MRKKYFFLGLIVLLFIVAILNTSNRNKETLSNKVTETKYGKVGKFTYSYFTIENKVMLTYDGNGIYVGNENITETSSLILFNIAKTINSISNDEESSDDFVNYERSYTKSRISNNRTSMKGKNGIYDITFALTGDYLTDITYKCNK
jgi:hypothetical protein